MSLAVRADGLGKAYKIGHQAGERRYRTLREDVAGWLRAPFSRSGNDERFWALKDVSFQVGQGEALGIIGRNGAGKSTLLKILSRITRPTAGYADVFGRVGSLLEIGTGFHQELTGRENIFMNGAVLGMTRRDIRRKFDEIVAFAEVERFLDTPVKRYSSGMYMRLAFAVAAHLEPEILIVDEVLAVGDTEFQKKCLGKMNEVAQGGRTVLFVSHNMSAIRQLCQTGLLLRRGQVADYGPVESVINHYLQAESSGAAWSAADDEATRWHNPYFAPTRFYVVDASGERIQRSISADECFGIAIEGEVEKLSPALKVGFSLYESGGELLFSALHTDAAPDDWPSVHSGHNRVVGWLPAHLLNEGHYRVELHLSLHFQEWIAQPGVHAPMIEFEISGGLSESPHWLRSRPGLLAPQLKFEVGE